MSEEVETPDEAPEAEAISEARGGDPADELAVPADPLSELSAERNALRDQLLRARAEFDNYRKRVARDMEQLRKTAAESLIKDLLPVVDNLERSLAHAPDKADPVVKGVELVMKQFADLLTARGLEPIAGLGQPFDPLHHEALAQQPSEEHPENHVMMEYERGYKLGDHVLRPARVVVSTGSATPKSAQELREDDEGVSDG